MRRPVKPWTRAGRQRVPSATCTDTSTGRPAFSGEAGAEVYRMAERADRSEALARLAGCDADPELVALARSCLAAAPKGRPRDAGMVVAGLTAYLNLDWAQIGRPFKGIIFPGEMPEPPAAP